VRLLKWQEVGGALSGSFQFCAPGLRVDFAAVQPYTLLVQSAGRDGCVLWPQRVLSSHSVQCQQTWVRVQMFD
jgi:hypothetical protein